jgi:hypothetical protein
MPTTQQERMIAAMSPRAKARAEGYLDSLYGIGTRRVMQHPEVRFDYDAGYRDGCAAIDRPERII